MKNGKECASPERSDDKNEANSSPFPTKQNTPSKSPPSKEFGQSASPDSHPPSSATPKSKRRRIRHSSPAPGGGDCAADTTVSRRSKNQPPSTPSTPATLSPSPYKVISGLIDATCHEILLVMGKDPESIAPFKFYAPLVERLDYYMGMLDHDRDEEENDAHDGGRGPIRDSGVRCRLFMTKLAIHVCSRLAYPEVFVDTSEPQQPKANFEPLIDMPASEWNELRQQSVKLLDDLQRGDGKMCPAFDSLDCQMQAMQALAKLRSRLLAVLRKIDDLDDPQREQSASRYFYIGDDVEEYKNSVAVIDGKLRDIHQTRHGDLFVPQQMLALKRFTTVVRMESSLTSVVDGISGMIDKKVFPLENFQVQFLKLLRDWENTYLDAPALFETGYFKSGMTYFSSPRAVDASTPVSPSVSTSPSRRLRKVAAKIPRCRDESDSDGESSECQFGSEDDRLSLVAGIQTKAKARPSHDESIVIDSDDSSDTDDSELLSALAGRAHNAKALSPSGSGRKERSHRRRKKGRSPPAKRHRDLDPDISIPDTPPTKSQTSKKKRKRIPFSEEETRALLRGMKRFPTGPDERGRWKEILAHYWEIFSVNNRTNVNLKDKHRNMLASGEI